LLWFFVDCDFTNAHNKNPDPKPQLAGKLPAMKYTDATIHLARNLYLRRAKVADIERETRVPRRTLYAWIDRFGWDALVKEDSVLEAINKRLLLLLEKAEPTDADLNAIDRLMTTRRKEIERTQPATEAPVAMLNQATSQVMENQAQDPQRIAEGKRQARKGKRGKNDFTGITAEVVESKFREGLFSYQLNEWAVRHKRRRFYLKSRQIGWTFYCAREAFADALMTGQNQVFLSASKAQALLFKTYIQSFALEWFGVELKGGEKITLRTDAGDATLFFLSTNSNTAQGPSGHVYLDECFWIRDFQKLEKLAGAIASHKHYRKTYFSTPSTKSHDAYVLWSGEQYRKIQEKRPELTPFKEPTRKQLRKGWTGVDDMYRKVITLHDAMDGGCDLFDLDQLQRENDPDTFAQLYGCEFIDDTNSAFNLNDLLACAVSDARWPDFNPEAVRPFGNRAVWVGYDPSRSRDSAVVVVLAPPTNPGGKFRLLEKHVMHNQNWVYQAELIRRITERYTVQHIGIDTTGPGNGVFERVLEFYPAAMNLHYTQDVKTRLVLKGQEVITGQRIEWADSHADIPLAFMAIQRASTGNGITYVAKRDNNIGHADAAWAIMHALIAEGLNSHRAPTSSYVLAEAA